MRRGSRPWSPWSFPISGRTYVTVGCRVACNLETRPRESAELREALKIFVLFPPSSLPSGRINRDGTLPLRIM